MTTHHSKNVCYFLIISFIFFSSVPSALAGELHDPPWTFLFGNHIDTHQETRIKLDKFDNPVSLSGSFYIIFTGETDPISGLLIARHPRGAGEHNEECGVDDIKCVKGWNMRGVPAEALFLYHSGVNGDDHPVWMLNRIDIPQPGSFTHFHWITRSSTDPGASAVPEECDANNASGLVISPDGNLCPGWLLEIHATRSFAFKHGDEIVPVRAGIDNASHLNLVTNYAEVEGIFPTR